MKTTRFLLPLAFIRLFMAEIACHASEKSNDIFRIDTIHEIKIHTNVPNYWEILINHYNQYHDADTNDKTPIMVDVLIDGQRIDSVGIKLKGNFSFEIPSDKKSMKIDFNAFVKGREYDGLRALNLSNEFPDPSFLRNTIAFKILRNAGAIAPRTSFAKVYFNNVYKGLYVLIEQIDKSFLHDRFEGQGGDLIKAQAGSLVWLEGNEEAFRKSYTFKSKGDSSAWARFISFAKKINNTDDSSFFEKLSPEFDFESYLPVFAADIVFNNWDSYFFGQNYYLFRENCSGKYFYLPWDYNVSLNFYDEERGPFELFARGDNAHFFQLPLPAHVTKNKILRKKYLDQICRINSQLSEDSLRDFILKMHLLIEPELLHDTGKVITMKQFGESLQTRIGISEIDFDGLLYFIKTRHEQIKQLLKAEGYSCN